MNKEIYKYVKKEYKRGVDLVLIRNNLVQNGWSPKEVDEAIAKATKTSHAKLYVLLLFFVITIGVSSSLLIVYYESVPNGEQINSVQNSPDIINNDDLEIPSDEESTGLRCEDVFDKEDCYMDKIVEEDFDCYYLEDVVERSACYRAKEMILFQEG